MGHHIQGFIAKKADLEYLQSLLHGAVIVALKQDYYFLPATYAIQDQIMPLYEDIGAFILPLSKERAFAYIETDYFGGQGGQSAAAWRDGKVLVKWNHSDNAINKALKAIGVKRESDLDAFDSVGLGKHRDMDDWETYDE